MESPFAPKVIHIIVLKVYSLKVYILSFAQLELPRHEIVTSNRSSGAPHFSLPNLQARS
jgi:hypothetical protein